MNSIQSVMEILEDGLEDAVRRLEEQTRELGEKLFKTDRLAREKVVSACANKMKDFIEMLGLKSMEVILNEKEEAEETIELTLKSIRAYSEHGTCDKILEEYKATQYAHEDHMKYLHMLYAGLTEDYLKRVLGVHLEKRVIQDEMHNKRAILTLRHATQCFRLSKEAEFAELREQLKTMPEEDGIELIELAMEKMRDEVEKQLAKNESFMREYRLNNIKINAELLEDAHKIEFPNIAKDFAP